jgi:Protein of unknown function (DUF3631)
MTLPPPNVCRRIRKLHAMLGSPNNRERETADTKLRQVLAEFGLTWNDLPTILAAVDPHPTNASSTTTQAASTEPKVNVLDLVLRLIELHVAVTPEERMAIALWILHTYVIFDDTRFTFTPRLALLSPVRGCGKTTMLTLLELLLNQPFSSDEATAAAIFHELDRRPRTTLLIDEADNLGLFEGNRALRTLFNSGHRKGRNFSRFVGGWSQQFSTFAPLAIAAIGALPLPLMHRSIVIKMARTETHLQRLDEASPYFPAAREEIRKWAATCELAAEPAMPPQLRHRMGDNWRVLLAIADGLQHGEEARTAAVALSANRPDEDYGVTALAHIRIVFD